MSEWRRNGIDGGGPYSVWKAPRMDWWAVLDRNGVNVLRDGEGSGGVFVSEESEAAALVREWNGS